MITFCLWQSWAVRRPLNVTLQQLRLFEAVIQEGGFTRAAKKVHLTQPAVSIQVKRLEQAIGMPLVEQIGKRSYPTEAGQALFSACQDILQRLGDLSETIDGLQGEVRGTLRISAVTSATYFLPHLIGEFLRRYPNVEPQLEVTNRASVIRSLSENKEDLYILGRPQTDLQIERHPFMENVIGIVAHPEHELAQAAGISMGRIVQERFLVREKGSGSRARVERHFLEEGHKVQPYLELAGDESVKQGVLAGLGVAALSLHNLHLEIATRRLVVLDVDNFPLRRRWYLVHRTGKRLSRAAQTFATFLQDEGEAIFQDRLARFGDGASEG